MFTGLIESIGTIKSVIPRSNYLVLTVVPDSRLENQVRGESIAISGACLTVVSFDDTSFTVEASQETIRLTTLKHLRSGSRVNIERALRADSRLGGHFVSGHIDGIVKVKQTHRIGQSLQVTVDLPEQFAALVVDKGAVAVDGISLTVIKVDENSFCVNVIPETQNRTTWKNIKVGDEINVEFDLIGKYLLRFHKKQEGMSRLTIDSMRQKGF